MNWYQTIWDQSFAANIGTQEASDNGRTNDYDTAGYVCVTTCDSNTMDYCHDLDEGGQSDWRMPTSSELYAASQHSNAGGKAYLASVADEGVWSSIVSVNDNGTTVNLVQMTTAGLWKGTASYAYCVRNDDRPPMGSIVVESQPASMQEDTSATLQFTPFAIRLRDQSGNYIGQEGVTVTLASASLGTLGGTLTASTDKIGRASFNAFTLDTVGSVTLTFEVNGLAPVTATVVVGTAVHSCKLEDTLFVTAAGGCKQVSTGKSWSYVSSTNMSWNDAVWGYVAGSFNTLDPTDLNDSGRANDYDGGAAAGNPDNSVVNYCHQLVQSGYSDWRLPTKAEVLALYSPTNGAAQHFAFNANQNFWSSTTAANTANAWRVNPVTIGTSTETAKTTTTNMFVMCVRP
jgi:hypothetical protein